MLTSDLNTSTKNLTLNFPSDVLSTNVEELKKQLGDLFDSHEIKNADVQQINMDLKAANMIDSAGLNFIVSIIRIAKNRKIAITAHIKSLSLHRTFLFTRLDKQLEIIVAD